MPSESACLCAQCGVEFWVQRSQLKKGAGLYCSRSCHSKSKVGDRGPSWKGGRHLKANGYIASKGTLEHRLVIERHLGRKLLGTEHVHHLNGIRSDNRIENLVVMDGIEHVRMHGLRPRPQRWSRLYDSCTTCGRTDRIHDGHGLCHACFVKARYTAKRSQLGALIPCPQ